MELEKIKKKSKLYKVKANILTDKLYVLKCNKIYLV